MLAAPAIVPVIPILPVLFTETTPAPVCEIPVIVNAAPFVKEIAPPPVLLALKFDMAFAPLSVSPPTDVAANVPPLINPAPLSAIVLLDVNDKVLALPAANVPVTLIAPVLPIVILPVPVCEMLEIVNGAAVFVSDNAPPPVFVALKVETAFAPPRVSPPTVVVAKVPVVLIRPEPLSAKVPLDVNVTLLAAPAIVPVTLILPVLFTETTPAPVCEMPVIVNADPFVSDTAPPPVFVALKVDTAFAPPRVSPPTETFVNVPVVLIKPEPLSANVPLDVNEILLLPPATRASDTNVACVIY